MAATNFTPISLYYSSTASAVPTAGNLVAGELALNNNDGKLFYKDSAGVVQTLATKATGSIGGSNTQVQYNNNGVLGGSANFVFDGTNVGIGTASPSSPLDVVQKTSDSTYALQLRGYTTGADGTRTANIRAVDSAAGNWANMGSYATSWIWNYQGVAERMRIDSSGNVGIGNTSPSAPLDIANTNSTSIAWQRTGVSAKKWGFVSDNSTTYLSNLTDGIANVIFPNAGGIQFNNSSAVTNSTLNDYETGSFSPTILFGGANAGQTFANGPNGRYVKIGKFVYITIGWYFTNKGSSTGNMTIGNLPFTADNFGFYGTYSPINLSGLTSVPNNIVMVGTNGGTSYINVYQGDCGTTLTNSNVSNGTYGIIGFSYTANF
jgi:hypothetical protein